MQTNEEDRYTHMCWVSTQKQINYKIICLKTTNKEKRYKLKRCLLEFWTRWMLKKFVLMTWSQQHTTRPLAVKERCKSDVYAFILMDITSLQKEHSPSFLCLWFFRLKMNNNFTCLHRKSLNIPKLVSIWVKMKWFTNVQAILKDCSRWQRCHLIISFIKSCN